MDTQSLFFHLNQHPEDLQRAFDWMMSAFQSLQKSPQAPPPKPPWEP